MVVEDNRPEGRLAAARDGEERRLRLELQVLADVGLIGAPNAGKTSLLRALTASSARVDVFPFTTLTPQLGGMELEPHQAERPIILAEIPGLIPDAYRLAFRKSGYRPASQEGVIVVAERDTSVNVELERASLQPDLWIKQGGNWLGDDVYNDGGAGQTGTRRVWPVRQVIAGERT